MKLNVFSQTLPLGKRRYANSLQIALYLVGPLFGGRLFIYAVVVYASWIGLFLALKVFLTQSKKGLQVRAYQILLGCLFSIVTPLVWFRNHIGIGIIVSLLIIIGFFLAYRADRIQQKGETHK